MTSVKSAISLLIITSFMIISCSNAKSAGVGDSTGMSDSASTVATATTPVQVSFQMLEGSWELYNASLPMCNPPQPSISSGIMPMAG